MAGGGCGEWFCGRCKSVRMLRSLFFVFLLPSSLTAQVLGYVDSVEVHRTDTVYFAFGDDRIDAAAAAIVRALVADRPGPLELYVEGHTDAVGGEAANANLAHRRALAVLSAARTAGWPDSAVTLRAFGEERLAVRTAGRERRNRRVLLRSGLPRRYARLRGRILNEDGQPLAGGAVASSRYLADTVRTDDEGYFVLDLPLDVGVGVDVYAPGHFFASRRFVLREGKQAPPLVFKLAAATAGRHLTIDNLYFVGNETTLLRESLGVPAKLLEFLRWNPELRVELAGHVNHPGEPQPPGTWSYRLSTDRARTIRAMMIAGGIDSTRLFYRGYSNHEMVNPGARSERRMRANRRVEVRVLDSKDADRKASKGVAQPQR